jgi:hypothetical protein
VTVSPDRRRRGLSFRRLPEEDTNAHGEDTVAFLEQPRRHIPGPMTVLGDRSNLYDRSKVVRAYLAKPAEIRTEKLPGSAAEMNPDELVWQHSKHGRLANFASEETTELRRELSGGGGSAARSCCRRSSAVPGPRPLEVLGPLATLESVGGLAEPYRSTGRRWLTGRTCSGGGVPRRWSDREELA